MYIFPDWKRSGQFSRFSRPGGNPAAPVTMSETEPPPPPTMILTFFKPSTKKLLALQINAFPGVFFFFVFFFLVPLLFFTDCTSENAEVIFPKMCKREQFPIDLKILQAKHQGSSTHGFVISLLYLLPIVSFSLSRC